MYLHLGGDVSVKYKSIIGIFDLDTASVSAKTRAFLESAQKRGEVINVTNDLPKSFVVTKDEGKTRLYITQVSSATLKKRAALGGYRENFT